VEGCQGSNQEVLALSFFKSRIFRNDGVDWSGVLFWREEFSSFGTLDYKIGLKTGEELLVSFARVLNSEILCASYCPTSSQIQPTSSRKNETRYV